MANAGLTDEEDIKRGIARADFVRKGESWWELGVSLLELLPLLPSTLRFIPYTFSLSLFLFPSLSLSLSFHLNL